MKKYRGIKAKRGSMVVEAAIFLPIFLIAILSLGFLIRQSGVEETVFHTALNQGRFASITAYSSRQAAGDAELSYDHGPSSQLIGLGARQLYLSGVQKQLEKEIRLSSDAVELKGFRYLYKQDERDDLIEAVVLVKSHVPLPRAFTGEIAAECCVQLRAFTGETSSRTSITEEELNTDGEPQLVYVFPRAGEKYHLKQCVVITSAPSRCVLTKSLQRRFDPCELCRADSLPVGAAVYCFSGAGESYHRYSCRSVERYIVEMEKAEARTQGYTACSKCGGGD